jgi:hypothetical protein
MMSFRALKVAAHGHCGRSVYGCSNYAGSLQTDSDGWSVLYVTRLKIMTTLVITLVQRLYLVWVNSSECLDDETPFVESRSWNRA